jgi:hypothetical protein
MSVRNPSSSLVARFRTCSLRSLTNAATDFFLQFDYIIKTLVFETVRIKLREQRGRTFSRLAPDRP